MHLRQPVRAPAEAVWNQLQNFGGIADWSPDATRSVQVEGKGIEPGAVREVSFTDKNGDLVTVRERITECGEGWFRYVLDGGIGPYTDAGSHWQVHGHGPSSMVEVRSHVRGAPWYLLPLTPLVHRQLRAGLKRALQTLEEQILEASSAAV